MSGTKQIRAGAQRSKLCAETNKAYRAELEICAPNGEVEALHKNCSGLLVSCAQEHSCFRPACFLLRIRPFFCRTFADELKANSAIHSPMNVLLRGNNLQITHSQGSNPLMRQRTTRNDFVPPSAGTSIAKYRIGAVREHQVRHKKVLQCRPESLAKTPGAGTRVSSTCARDGSSALSPLCPWAGSSQASRHSG